MSQEPKNKPEAFDPLKDALEQGYAPVKLLADGSVAGVMDMCFTAGLFRGISPTGYETRFCYEKRTEAEEALATWDGTVDPEGPWIKQKPENRFGPGAIPEIKATGKPKP